MVLFHLISTYISLTRLEFAPLFYVSLVFSVKKDYFRFLALNFAPLIIQIRAALCKPTQTGFRSRILHYLREEGTPAILVTPTKFAAEVCFNLNFFFKSSFKFLNCQTADNQKNTRSYNLV